MAKALPKLACALLAFAMLGQKTTAQSLFAKAKEDSNKSLEVYVATLNDYFSRWSSLMLAEPVKGEDGQPAIHVNPAQRRLDFTMRISVNEDAYSAWKSEAFKRLTEAGISEAGGDGIFIGGKTWAFPNKQGIEAWQKDVEMPRMTFRVMLVDAQGAEVRSLEFHEKDVRKREIVKTEYEAMLRSWTEVKTNSVSTLPLYWLGRMKDYPSFESTNWLSKEQDGDSCFVQVGFEKLTDDEMERAASVKCVVLSPSDIENEQIDKEKAFWREQSDEDASHAVLSLISDLIQVPHKQYALGRHTVSQSQWEAIMGNNPVEDASKRGGDKPMLGAEYKSIAQFIARINAHSSLYASGIRFRVPTVEEWQTAALAGKSGKFASFISRYGAKRDLAAGANEWGFNDILAGCWERVAHQDREAGWVDDGWYACAGGTMDGTLVELLSLPIRYRDLENPYVERHVVGLRLCADWTPELQAAIAKAKDGLSSTAEEASPDDIVKNIMHEMINVPGTSILIGKYEVSQTQWEAVMEGNPSKHQGKNFPVESVSENQVKEFLSRLNANTAVIESGLKFLLPAEEMWKKAALAGGLSEDALEQKFRAGEISGDEFRKLKDGRIENRQFKRGFGYGRLADGTEAEPNDVAWHGGDDTHSITTSIDSEAQGMTHKVGLKKPNAFGFFDMCGNVAEIVIHGEPYSPDHYVAIGGSFESKPQYCSVDHTDKYNVWDSSKVGIRLCARDMRLAVIDAVDVVNKIIGDNVFDREDRKKRYLRGGEIGGDLKKYMLRNSIKIVEPDLQGDGPWHLVLTISGKEIINFDSNDKKKILDKFSAIFSSDYDAIMHGVFNLKSNGKANEGVIAEDAAAASDKNSIVIDAVDIVFQVLRDKAHAEQLIRNQLGNDVNDVIIRAEGLDDSHVRGNANDVVQEFTLYFQKHSQEIVKKAREKAGLK